MLMQTSTRNVPPSLTLTIQRPTLGVEVFADAAGLLVMGFSGKRQKHDFYIRFQGKERADAYVSDWLQGLEKRAQNKAEARASRQPAVNLLQVGDVLVSSWGYEQTNVDYYEVTKLIGRLSVEVQEIRKSVEGCGMSGTCTPCPGDYIGPPNVYRVTGGNAIKVRSFGAYAVKKDCDVIDGKKVFRADRWTAYA